MIKDVVTFGEKTLTFPDATGNEGQSHYQAVGRQEPHQDSRQIQKPQRCTVQICHQENLTWKHS